MPNAPTTIATEERIRRLYVESMHEAQRRKMAIYDVIMECVDYVTDYEAPDAAVAEWAAREERLFKAVLAYHRYRVAVIAIEINDR